LKKSPTGPAFTKDPLKNKSPITSNNKVFIADNSLNRLACLRWTSKSQRKENFYREGGAGTIPETQPKLQPLAILCDATPPWAFNSQRGTITVDLS